MTDPPELRGLETRLYRRLACYDFRGDFVCWVSQARLAKDLGVCRSTANRVCQRLRAKGYLRWTKQRGTRWNYNVYELLEPYSVSDLAAKRITRRAHAHTNRKLGGSRCHCWACRPVTRVRRGQTPSQQMRDHLRRGFETYEWLALGYLSSQKRSDFCQDTKERKPDGLVLEVHDVSQPGRLRVWERYYPPEVKEDVLLGLRRLKSGKRPVELWEVFEQDFEQEGVE